MALYDVQGVKNASQIADDASASGAAERTVSIKAGQNVTEQFYNVASAAPEQIRTPTVFKTVAAVAITASTPQALWTPATGKKFRLMGWQLSPSAAASIIFKDGTSEVIRTAVLAINGVSNNPTGFGNGILSAAANNVLNADVSASATISGFVFGTEE